MEAMIGQIFKEFPFWLATVTVVFLGILLIIWLLLPLWVLFIQWNTGKMKDEIRRLADLIEKKDRHEKKQESSELKP
jgi:cell division protein FtsL